MQESKKDPSTPSLNPYPPRAGFASLEAHSGLLFFALQKLSLDSTD
jgi:hypothetical protein